MSQIIKLRRSAVAGRIPTTESIELGELAMNTYDGKLFMKRSSSAGEEIIEVVSGPITGSLLGSSSYALTSSFASFAKTAQPIDTVIYVSATNGNDSNDGRTLGSAFKTIRKACESAATYPNLMTQSVAQITASYTSSADDYNTFTDNWNTVVSIVSGGLGVVPSTISNTNDRIKVTGTTQYTQKTGSNAQSASISASFSTIYTILSGGLSATPTIIYNTSSSVRLTGEYQDSTGTACTLAEVALVSASFSIVYTILSSSVTQSGNIGMYPMETMDEQRMHASASLDKNKPLIAAETIAYISSSWSTFQYNEASCSRDIGYIIDGVAFDLKYESTTGSIGAGNAYVAAVGSLTNSTQKQQTLDAIRFASGVAQKVIRNVILQDTSQIIKDSRQNLLSNKQFIQSETIAYLSSSWSTFQYNEASCSRDIGHMIDAALTDLIYGGNERAVTAGRYYYLYPSQATGSQLNQTLEGIKYASELAQNVLVGKVFVTASQSTVDTINLIKNNKNFIQQNVIGFISYNYPGLVYNTVSCSRDVGYLIDAAVTDLKYGGNEKSVIAGSSYWNGRFGNANVVTSQQLEPTINSFNYAKNIIQRIITGVPLGLYRSKMSIEVKSGDYTEVTPIIVPPFTSILGDDLRSVSVRPTTATKNENTFLLNNACYIAGMTFRGHELYPNVDNATKGFAIAFASGAFITTSPYVQNCSSITNIEAPGAYAPISPYNNPPNALVGIGGGGIIVDSEVLSTNSPLKSMVTDAFTQVSMNGIGLQVQNKGFVQMVSFFTNFCRYAVKVTNGGHATLLNSNTSFGDYGMWAQGSRILDNGEVFGSLIVTTGHDFSYCGAGTNFTALPPNQGGVGVAVQSQEINEVDGGRVFFTSGNETGDFYIGGDMVIRQETGTLEGRTFSKSLFALVTPFVLALEG